MCHSIGSTDTRPHTAASARAAPTARRPLPAPPCPHLPALPAAPGRDPAPAPAARPRTCREGSAGRCARRSCRGTGPLPPGPLPPLSPRRRRSFRPPGPRLPSQPGPAARPARQVRSAALTHRSLSPRGSSPPAWGSPASPERLAGGKLASKWLPVTLLWRLLDHDTCKVGAKAAPRVARSTTRLLFWREKAVFSCFTVFLENGTSSWNVDPCQIRLYMDT